MAHSGVKVCATLKSNCDSMKVPSKENTDMKKVRYLVIELTESGKQLAEVHRQEKHGFSGIAGVTDPAVAAESCEQGGVEFPVLKEYLGGRGPCYVLYDWPYVYNNMPKSKVILISWMPDTSSAKAKMIYSSSKAALLKALDVNLEFNCNDMSDLDYQVFTDKCQLRKD